MAQRTTLAIDVGLHHLHAVEAVVDRGRVAVSRVISTTLPEGTHEASPEERGHRVRQALQSAGVTATRAVFTLPRERVIVKKLEFPGAERHELANMVRLAMMQESSIGADGVHDFTSMQGAGAMREVWAVGAPRAELEAVQRMARAAGLEVLRVAPRTCGTAMLLGTLPAGAIKAAAPADPELSLAFDLTSETAELVAADRTGLRATRGTSIASDAPDAAVKEARRSWTAFRLSQPDMRPSRAVVLASDESVAALADAIGGEIPVQPLHAHPDIEHGAHSLTTAWPLAGLLLELARKGDCIDLAHPSKSPDVASRRRIRVYAAVAVVAGAYCLGWAVGKTDRETLESQRTMLAKQDSSARKEFQRMKRDELKLRHLDAWNAAQPSWLDTMLRLQETTPQPRSFLLAGWGGQVEDATVVVNKEGAFSLPASLRVQLDLEAHDRESVDALREALMARREWTVRSTTSEGKAGHTLPLAVELLLLSQAEGQKAEP